ncbi:IclR DNA-binding transcriptional regulator [Corynebacterium humireducens NBRC 106098 = DSM 45392]|uniref:IclR DNA-binding transcriptional regulator n=1 Tax=Corynebacterium humireducens NBRC 106098 = DSM 45392 TaxID=1223515 RepID=A0A0B5D219_9CORY|nr:IclR family transcriptional regulator [Corynebacterium humireducens]AJE32895.1 IclR DNA-binding transcriptional regulator [Corynebacterium humireducens NBRC 106098 = DSM 45392]
MGQVPAARHTLRILSLLSSIDVPVSAARIMTELDLPRSSTYHLLAVMESEGYVVRIPETRTYGLGMAAYAMASAYTTQQPLVRLGAKLIAGAADLVGGSGHISRLAGSEIVYLHEVRAAGAVSLVTEVGVRLSAAGTASGRAMLAHLPAVEARAAFATNHGTGATLRSFQEQLATVRERGWAEEYEEVSRGQRSVAVAVLDHLGRPAAALAVTFRIGSVPEERIPAVAAELGKAAAELSQRMYGTS